MSGGTKITPKVYLPAGTMVKATKVAITSNSKIDLGSVYYGHLKEDLKVQGLLEFQKGSFHSSRITSIVTTSASDYIVNTKTSVYFVQKI